jgi:pilus assembly protein CpaB
MKNIKAFVLLFLAVAIGLAAAVYAAAWTSQHANIASNKVVVAAVDMDAGSKINAQMLSTVDWPSSSLPPGAVQDIKLLQDRVVKVSVLRGEPVIDGKLAPVGTLGGLSAVIAEGKRAMTVRVNDVVGVAGFALPGTYVDVMVNAQKDKDGNNAEGRQISKTVLEHVLVLAVAQESGRDDTKPKVVSAVTLELSLEDSERLDLARSIGTLSLVLRNQTAGITKSQLFGEAAPEPIKMASGIKPVVSVRPVRAKPVAQSTNCVEIIQNGARVLNCFE